MTKLNISKPMPAQIQNQAKAVPRPAYTVMIPKYRRHNSPSMRHIPNNICILSILSILLFQIAYISHAKLQSENKLYLHQIAFDDFPITALITTSSS